MDERPTGRDITAVSDHSGSRRSDDDGQGRVMSDSGYDLAGTPTENLEADRQLLANAMKHYANDKSKVGMRRRKDIRNDMAEIESELDRRAGQSEEGPE